MRPNCATTASATAEIHSGGGIGGALYERCRQSAIELGAVGLFFECLPDDPALCSDPAFARQNAARLRFYERYGARPIVGTDYELPIHAGDQDLPHLVFDDLGTGKPLSQAKAREVISAILHRKYAHICTPEYIAKVVDSVRDDPVRIREPRYLKASTSKLSVIGTGQIAFVVNESHDIHHVKERGYVEAPVRVRSLLKGLEPTGLFRRIEHREFGNEHILAVHSEDLFQYLEKACANVPEGKSVYPYVFPVRNRSRVPLDLSYCAGYYCIDTFTPINQNAFLAARQAVNCTLTAAETLLHGDRLAYSLVRPPGHHAERSMFGGFCYFNNNAIAAHRLSRHGRVAILDIDYHHGNGQQDIFYHRSDVLTVSLHGDPSIAYPFFTGFADERGEGDGEGFNVNIPLPEELDGEGYRNALRDALARIAAFEPSFLVVALGLDTAKRDPTGTWSLQRPDFELNGELIGALGIPTVVVQEGGYRTVSLGGNAASFFTGLVHAHAQAQPRTS